MIVEITKQKNGFVLKNFPKNKKRYFIDITVEKISTMLPNNKKTEKDNTATIQKAIKALEEVLKLEPENEFVKRKIQALKKNKPSTITMTDKEALYLALSDKYEL